MAQAVAVYGGSFDPPHVGHLLVAAYVLATHPVERLLVVPVAGHAFGKPLSPFDDRIRMCELAFADLKRLEVCAIERELPLPSLTIRTLEALQLRMPDAQLRLVIGSDVLPEVDRWFEFERVRTLAPPIVVPRAGRHAAQASGPALPNINSTELRERLRAGISTEGHLHPAVAAHAIARGLYIRPAG